MVETIAEIELTGLLLSGIIAEAARAVKEIGIDKETMRKYAECDITAMHLPADEYERAIALLTEALGI